MAEDNMMQEFTQPTEGNQSTDENEEEEEGDMVNDGKNSLIIQR
jgi:hypothetical protein